MATPKAGWRAQENLFVNFIESRADPEETAKSLQPLVLTIVQRRFGHLGLSYRDVEEIVQETWIGICALAPGAYDPTRGGLGTFLFMIIRDAVKRFRRNGRPAGVVRSRTVISLDKEGERLADPEHGDAIRAADARVDAESLISRVPGRTRPVLEFMRSEDLSLSDAAGRAGVERTAVYRDLRVLRASCA